MVRFGDLPVTAWEDGALPVRNLFQTHDWLAAACETHGEGPDTPALIVGAPEAPEALAVLRRDAGGLRLIGGIDIGESAEILWRDETAKDALVRGLAGQGKAVDFGHYPLHSGLFNGLQASGKGRVLRRALPSRAMPVLSLDGDWTDPLTHLSRNRRQQLRRKFRKAETMGDVAVEITAPGVDEVDTLFDRAIAIEAKSWKGPAGTALIHDRPQADFYRAFGRRMAAKGLLRLCFLTIGGRDAAMEYAAIWDDRFWSIKLGYDEAFAAVSPGEAIRVQLIAHAAAQGLRAFEFCGKEAAWSRVWTDDAVEIAALRFYPTTAAGMAKLARDGAGRVWRKLKR